MYSVLLTIIVQVVEGLVCFSFYENISKIPHSKWKRLLSVTVSYLIMCGLNLIFDYSSQINLIALIIFQFLFVFVLYKEKLIFSIFLSLLFSLSVAITEIIASSMILIITNSYSIDFSEEPVKYVLLILISKALLFFEMKIIGDVINKYRSNEKIDVSFFFYIFSLFIVLLALTKLVFEYKISTQNQILITAASLILLIAVVITCIVQQQTSQKTKELFELKAENQKQELDNTYFNLLEHQNEELQIFVHDTKKHFNNLYDLLDNSDKAKEYIKNIVNDLEESNNIGKTENKLLDLIINKYTFLCREHGITLEKNIHYSDLNFIEDNDLTSLFNNLFDNAVEASHISCSKHISFDINKINDMIVIDMSNSCDTPPVVKGNHLISTKRDKSFHGYGFKSISRVVKKYGGDIEWEYDKDEKEFSVSILITIKGTKNQRHRG